MDCYFYFEVPTGVLNSYKTCTVKLGVDSSFSVKFRKNGGYDFNMCDSVFEIDLPKKASTGAFSFGSASAFMVTK